MKLAIIGAGPAGLISARNAIEQGFDVVLFEKLSQIGGIWNPESTGAYLNTYMQNSKDSFHFTSFAYNGDKDFLGVQEVYEYLNEMFTVEGISSVTRLNTEVTALNRTDKGWNVTSVNKQAEISEEFDNVIIATGELWEPKKLECNGLSNFKGEIYSSREYQDPNIFKGKKVLVVGGGVSGADIASDLVSIGRKCYFVYSTYGALFTTFFR